MLTRITAYAVVFRRGRRRKLQGPTSSTAVGPFADLGPVDHHRGQQMGVDHHPHGSALSQRPGLGGKEALALRRIVRSAVLQHARGCKKRTQGSDARGANEAIGHGVRAKRSKSGAVSFDILETETAHAPVR
jgi:hypothetical protein